ncbi:phosphatase [candidate division WOR-1 bacterium RIFCSPHIGHO2_01_FULL_53_15]|uniref:Phosphatase n=1 Tax=candidate division WOR-1 bacterium RIFCSPHIGHO2_01_FULL_53_15 TaxID=1802564 RepID=A0A1F4PZX7_UNCSA|nr:MAG: phosphatase [candidate division WOR-1 bacterium RIFCSPHIGHO2_01_FULL_53_15]OGC10818.1 MAG: phosphatase [candidate division WOR-1 bacterium RIFCSPHIGHO2_02_FULL_53_26]
MKLVADLHVHTVSSGHAYSTLEEYVRQAKKIGLEGFAVADHGPAMPGGPHYYHFSNMRMIPREIDGIKILRGIEANIINEAGEIDMKPEDLKWGELDIVMAAMHPRVGYEEGQGEEKNTEVLIRAMQNPIVNVVAHPGNPRYPVKIKETVAAAKAAGVLIEINNSSDLSRPGSCERCLEVAREVKKQGWKVVLGTDSHISSMLGVFDSALKLVKEAGLTEDEVVNTSWQKIEKYLLFKTRSLRC